MRKFFTTLVAAGTVLGGVSQVHAAFAQGFESDTSGWSGSLTRVASGTNGITSSSGSFHATIAEGSDPYTFSGTTSSTPWPGSITTSIDVYIDTAQGIVGEGWAWDVGLYSSTNTFLEASGFGAEKTAAGEWSIVADGDGAGYTSGGAAITSTGWYRLVSNWGDDSGTLTRNSYVYGPSNALIYSNEETTSYSTSVASGKEYAWFADVGVSGGLAIDNAVSVPEPASLGLLALGGVCVLARRRR